MKDIDKAIESLEAIENICYESGIYPNKEYIDDIDNILKALWERANTFERIQIRNYQRELNKQAYEILNSS